MYHPASLASQALLYLLSFGWLVDTRCITLSSYLIHVLYSWLKGAEVVILHVLKTQGKLLTLWETSPSYQFIKTPSTGECNVTLSGREKKSPCTLLS